MKTIITSNPSGPRSFFEEQFLTNPCAEIPLTTIRPRGTTSILSGASSGVHLDGTKPYLRDIKIRGQEITGIWLDELAEIEDYEDFDMAKDNPIHPEVHEALTKLAERMTAWFVEQKINGSYDDTKLSLLAPSMLTVNTPGKGYKKHNHIGGEEFYPQSVYVGKTNRLIFVFKPVDAQPYSEMEMTENEAQTQLDKFRSVANMAAGGNFLGELKAIRELESKAREQEAMKDKFNEYAEFGSW